LVPQQVKPAPGVTPVAKVVTGTGLPLASWKISVVGTEQQVWVAASKVVLPQQVRAPVLLDTRALESRGSGQQIWPTPKDDVPQQDLPWVTPPGMTVRVVTVETIPLLSTFNSEDAQQRSAAERPLLPQQDRVLVGSLTTLPAQQVWVARLMALAPQQVEPVGTARSAAEGLRASTWQQI